MRPFRAMSPIPRRITMGVVLVAAGVTAVVAWMLGPDWRIVDYHPEDPDFLAIGPGGIFQVTVCDHGRSRVELAGEVVQVNGRRPPYVALARRDA